MPGTYISPADVWISCSRQCHVDRNPPSSEPGTDYATAYGTGIRAAERGTVVDLSWSNGGGTGRYVTIALDDGWTVRYLHLSAIYVEIGWAVDRGAIIAASGASGFGSDWGYGPHVHVTLWEGPAWASPTRDFEAYLGDVVEPPPEPKPIIPNGVKMLCVHNTDDGSVYVVGERFLHHVPGSTEADVAANLYNVGQTWRVNSATKRIDLPGNFFGELLDSAGIPRSAAEETLGGKTWHNGTLVGKDAAAPTTATVSGPLVAIGVFVGILGVLEAIRIVLDVLT